MLFEKITGELFDGFGKRLYLCGNKLKRIVFKKLTKKK